MSQRAQRAIFKALDLGASPYVPPESQQCAQLITDERERYGRHVVAQNRCRKRTRDESGYCSIHRPRPASL